MRYALPRAGNKQTVGLLGGSFDPPHAGHLHVSRVALARFGLDRLWWLVSPGNPLKELGPASLDRRMQACRDLVQDPRIEVTDIEARIGTIYTAATLRALFALYPQVRFTWLMGADNLAGFHKWHDWEWIAEKTRIGVVARPGDRAAALNSPMARKFARTRLSPTASRKLAQSPDSTWCFLNAPLMDVSSSAIRARGEWTRRS